MIYTRIASPTELTELKIAEAVAEYFDHIADLSGEAIAQYAWEQFGPQIVAEIRIEIETAEIAQMNARAQAELMQEFRSL